MRDVRRTGSPPLLLLVAPGGSRAMEAARTPVDEAASMPSVTFRRRLDRAASADIHE